ncbi:peptide deformylase [Carboxylicivirga sp. RSCT41]|uniref:peptide deformylase n=1 Tax=Carboxylicivirga agarovorans TaxID=3417570 RepID=UPI003D34A130
MILPVAVYGHPVLRKVAKVISKDDPDIKNLIKDLWSTMYRTDGIGLAAPQVAKSVRVFVIDADVYKDEFPELKGFRQAFINPQLKVLSDKKVWMNEGCISVPTVNKQVKRPDRIELSYQDEEMNCHIEVFEGMAARIIQHEYDHLEGKLFIDYLNPLSRLFLNKKLKSISSGKVNIGYKIIDNKSVERV